MISHRKKEGFSSSKHILIYIPSLILRQCLYSFQSVSIINSVFAQTLKALPLDLSLTKLLCVHWCYGLHICSIPYRYLCQWTQMFRFPTTSPFVLQGFDFYLDRTCTGWICPASLDIQRSMIIDREV